MLGILDELDEAALIEILTKPRNAILKQYAKLFDYEGVKVTFTDEAAGRLRARRCSARLEHAACA